MNSMPQWQQIVPQHASVVWRTVCRLLPTNQAPRAFTATFMASRSEARRDSVADWTIMLQRLATSRAVAAWRELVTDSSSNLSGRLRAAMTTLPDQQAVLYCLRYLSGFTFNEIAMELALPLDGIGRATNEACTRLGRQLLDDAHMAAQEQGQPEHRAADDLLEQATAELRDLKTPEMPPDLQQTTIDELIAAGPIASYEKPVRKSPLAAVISICVLAVVATAAIGLYITKRPKPPAFAFDAVMAAIAPKAAAGFQIVRTIPMSDNSTRKMLANVVMGDHQHLRQTLDAGNPVIIWDLAQQKTLTLDATKNRATLRDVSDMPEEFRLSDPVALIKGLPLADVKTGVQTTIGGRPAQAFNCQQAGDRLQIWADVETRLPVLLEVSSGEAGTAKLLFSDFDWNPRTDPSMFALDTPEGYQLEAMKVNVTVASEQDLVAALRVAASLNGGKFPDEFSRAGMSRLMVDLRQGLPKDTASPEYRDAQMQLERDLLQLGRGWLYIAENGEDWHYAAAGVYLGSDRPVMWYHPNGSRFYHVIDASLSIRPTNPDRLPEVPSTQMIRPTTQPRRINP